MNRVLSWDWKHAPPAAVVVDAVNAFDGGPVHATEVDTGSDDYVVVLSSAPLTAAEALQIWDGD